MATKSTGGTEKTKSIEVKKKLINVLIVDDDPLNRRLHEMIIKTIGGISQTAKNGEEAVILHRDGEASFDLILMDKEMPERDGVSVLNDLDSWSAYQIDNLSGSIITILKNLLFNIVFMFFVDFN